MFELTNEQRKYFGLNPIHDHYKHIKVKASPYDDFETYVYIENHIIRKVILVSSQRYLEYDSCEQLSNDELYLLPKTSRGKPVLFSSSNLLKRKAIGMCLNYNDHFISLYSELSQMTYYSLAYEDIHLHNINDFKDWVNHWCKETTNEDLLDIIDFSKQKRKHIKFKEGDVFRYKINRRLYGYGRILLDYDKMRKNKEIFWDILMSKPLVCSVYHIVTLRKDVSIDELKQYVKSSNKTDLFKNNNAKNAYTMIAKYYKYVNNSRLAPFLVDN